MIAHTIVERHTVDGLGRKRWMFYLTSRLEIVLETYHVGTRPSRRHRNYSIDEVYSRLNHDRRGIPYGAKMYTKPADVPMPDDVRDEAWSVFCDKIRFNLTEPT